MPLIIQTRDNQIRFAPRDRVTGDVSWQLDAPPASVELRLRWSTTGRGDSDESVVETMPFPNPQANETRPFAFTLPDGPYSFSGKLMTLTWALELAVEPDSQFEGVEITVAPEGRAIVLPQVTKES